MQPAISLPIKMPEVINTELYLCTTFTTKCSILPNLFYLLWFNSV